MNHGHKKIDDERGSDNADDDIHGYNFSQTFIYRRPNANTAIVMAT
jgi:hypothetical protein